MQLFEVFLVDGRDGSDLLSKEVLDETGAQIFTPEQAAMVGLEGVPVDPENRPRVFIACGPSDHRLIQSRLEGNDAVGSFKLHVL